MAERKTIVVTGANRGIGRGIVAALARQGHRIVMACRDPAAARLVLERIELASGDFDIELARVDLASIASIRDCASRIAAAHARVDVLINNAGVFCHEISRTEDGFERTVGVNYLGTYCLTRLLEPLVPRGGRIVNTTSVAALYRGVSPGDLPGAATDGIGRDGRYHGFKAYARSKLGILLFTTELAARLEARGVSANAVHPGIVSTGMIRMGKWYDPLTDLVYRPFIATEDEGAAPAVRLASSAEVEGVTGAYFSKASPRRLPARIADWPGRARLWDETAALAGLPG